ncbi:MAG: AAA family ATPase [Spirochaetaceae bacterium]|nr:AAA family ATPase [Spirochaetaceae bacterium]
MHLKSLHIQNYRGIKELKLENLGQINIFTGNNNSGKSTVLEAGYQVTQISNPDAMISISELRMDTIRDNNDWLNFFYENDPVNEPIFEAEFNNNEERRLTISANLKDLIVNSPIDGFPLLKNKIFTKQVEALARGLVITIEVNRNKYEYKLSLVSVSGSLRLIIEKSEGLTGDNYKEKIKTAFIKNPFYMNTLPTLLIMQEDERENLINEDLRKLYPLISRYIVDTQRNAVKLKLNNNKTIPLSAMGDGIRNLINISTHLRNKNHIIFIDEIENGFHYSFYPTLWQSLISIAKEAGVQLFIATHSYECLKALSQNLDGEVDTKLFKLRHKDETHKVSVLDNKGIRTVIDDEIERIEVL